MDNYLLEVDKPLVVPQGVKIRVLLTSADVIHAWWVPDFGIKRDAIPGFINEIWFKADTPGCIAASAPSSAGATTASCRWSSRSSHAPNSTPGSPRRSGAQAASGSDASQQRLERPWHDRHAPASAEQGT